MKKLSLSNLDVMLPTSYTAGHRCTALEAAALNTALHKRIKDRLRRRFAGRTEYTPSMQAIVHAIVHSASINGNPVETEAKAIALQVAKRLIKDDGKLIKSHTNQQIRELAERVLTSPGGRVIRNLAISHVEDIEEAVRERQNEQD